MTILEAAHELRDCLRAAGSSPRGGGSERSSAEKRRQFIAVAFPVAEKAVALCCGRYGRPQDVDEVVAAFLQRKLLDGLPEFLDRLIASEATAGYFFRVAYNFAISLLRERRGVVLQEGSGETDRASQVGDDDEAPADGEIELAEHLEEVEAAWREFHRLPLKDRVVLKVFHAHNARFEDEEIAWIAQRRGVSGEQARGDLKARALRLEERQRALEEEIEERGWRIRRLERRHQQVHAIVCEMDGYPQEPPDYVDPKELRTDLAIRYATPAQRSGLLARITLALRRQDQLRSECVKRLMEDPVVGKPDWAEVATLAGYYTLGKGSPEEEQERLHTARNTAQQDLKRAIARARKKRPQQ